MKTLSLILAIIFGFFVVVTTTSFYPVALVDGSILFLRTWHKAEEASRRFTNLDLQSRGAPTIDFADPGAAEILLDIKKGTLTFLIEDIILIQEGKRVIEGFEVLSRERVVEALKGGGDSEKAAQRVYGLSFQDFRGLVLMPQARRDVLKEALQEKGQDFEEWFRGVKKGKEVRLFFVPFSWNGELVE